MCALGHSLCPVLTSKRCTDVVICVVFVEAASSSLYEVSSETRLPSLHAFPRCPGTPPQRKGPRPVSPEASSKVKAAAAALSKAKLSSLPIVEPDEDDPNSSVYLHRKDNLVLEEEFRLEDELVPPPLPGPDAPMPTVRQRFSTAQKKKWVQENLDERIRVKLYDRNGKDSLSQCFKSEATLQHVLLPMMKRGFLEEDSLERKVLPRVCRDFKSLFDVMAELADVDFNPVKNAPGVLEGLVQIHHSLRGLMAVEHKGYQPFIKDNDVALFVVLDKCLVRLCWVLGVAGMIAILVEGLEVSLCSLSIAIFGNPRGHDPFIFC